MQIGDKVRFTPEWLRNTFNYTGDMPLAGGPVTEIVPLSEGRAFITFDCPILGEWTALSTNLEVWK